MDIPCSKCQTPFVPEGRQRVCLVCKMTKTQLRASFERVHRNDAIRIDYFRNLAGEDARQWDVERGALKAKEKAYQENATLRARVTEGHRQENATLKCMNDEARLLLLTAREEMRNAQVRLLEQDRALESMVEGPPPGDEEGHDGQNCASCPGCLAKRVEELEGQLAAANLQLLERPDRLSKSQIRNLRKKERLRLSAPSAPPPAYS